jgi:kynurenine formamidase
MSLVDRQPPTQAEYDVFPSRFSNWGRWPDRPELGALNFITPEARVRAVGLVEEGAVVSLGRPIDTVTSPANPYPAHHMVPMEGTGGPRDYIGMFIHGHTQTHIDALAHIPTSDGRTWDGRPMGANGMPSEHSGTIDFWREGIVTRGVLYDVPRFRGVDSVTPGSPVHGWELEAIAAAEGIEPRSGDAAIVRSGAAAYWNARPDEPRIYGSVAGLHASCIEYLHEQEVSSLVWDFQDAPTADQGIDSPIPPHSVHLHAILIPYMGVGIVDNAELEELAEACARRQRWEFLLVVAPLNIPRGTGSPVNPLAVF